METIRKIISLEKSRTRQCGVLPFIPFNVEQSGYTEEGTYTGWTCASGDTCNWGGFPADMTGVVFNEDTDIAWSGNTEGTVRYAEMMRRYNIVQAELRKGIYLKKVNRTEMSECYPQIERYVRSGWTRETRYDFVPVPVENFTEINRGYKCVFDGFDAENVVLIDDFAAFSRFETSAYTFSKEVEQFLGLGEPLEAYPDLLVPYIEVPVLLTQEINAFGLYTSYIDGLEDVDFDGNVRSLECSGLSSAFTNVMTSRAMDNDEINVESRLSEYRVEDISYSDEGLLPGVFKPFSAVPQYFKCTYHKQESKQPVKKAYVVFTYVYTDDEGEHSITRQTEEKCVQEETPAWPSSENVYQVIKYPIENGSSTAYTEENEYDEFAEYQTGKTYDEGTITESVAHTTAYTASYEWWEAEPISGEGLHLADGFSNAECKNAEKYRVLTCLNAIYSLVPERGENNDGDTYNFLVKYDNGVIYPISEGMCDPGADVVGQDIVVMDIPFKTGVAFNVVSPDSGFTDYIGDFISNIERNEDNTEITFTYHNGGRFFYDGDNKMVITDYGITFVETYPIYTASTMHTTIDGASDVIVYYDDIDFDSMKHSVRSDAYRLERDANTARVDSYKRNSIWTSKGSIQAPVFMENEMIGISEAVKEDIYVEINRGIAAAWEKHMGLSECNTMEDLENYRNNTYNL